MVRRCVEDYEMIRPGDRVAVGVSGGKDSLALLVFLSELKKYPQMDFDLEAVTIDMGMGMDYSGVRGLCDRPLYDCPHSDWPHHFRLSERAESLFHVRQNASGGIESDPAGPGTQ